MPAIVCTTVGPLRPDSGLLLPVELLLLPHGHTLDLGPGCN